MALADGESQNHESRHGSELGPGRNILQQRSPAQSDHVDVSEHNDEEKANEMSASQRNAQRRDHNMLLRNHGNDVAHVRGRSHGERRDRPAVGDAE